VAAVIALAQALRAYYRGSSVLIGAVGAHDLASESVRTQMVADVVNEMALAARIPRPRLYLMEDPAPNASAAGRDPADSVICVTQGLVDQLYREELQGVIAHEMAHIRGHDTRITQMTAVMVSGFALVSGSILRSVAAQRRGETTIRGMGSSRFLSLSSAASGGFSRRLARSRCRASGNTWRTPRRWNLRATPPH
jgi:heat shock protein HtpX